VFEQVEVRHAKRRHRFDQLDERVFLPAAPVEVAERLPDVACGVTVREVVV